MVKKSRVSKRRFPTGNQAVMPQRSSSATPKPTATERLETLPALALSSSSDYCQEDGAMTGNPVHLLLCTNSLYLQHVGVCLTSLLVNNSDLFFNIVIVGRATEALDEEKLRRSLAGFANHSLSFKKFIPPADRMLPLNPQAHYTLDNWTRLWVGDFFADDIDRVLYLDGDIVVVGDVAPLWCTDLGGTLLGAVDIPGSLHGVTTLAMRAEDGYFNSGVLLIDLKQWRETQALDTILRYVDAYPERMRYTLDQDALNACFHGRRKRLDYKWNATWSFFREPIELPLAPPEIENVRREARIIHFNSNLKPWSYFCDHPRKGEYEKYLRLTEWRDFVPEDRTIMNRLRKGVSTILPERVKRGLKTLAPTIFDRSQPSVKA
jgi:lipopolysaccharide biosynthesis glycosyltransferase